MGWRHYPRAATITMEWSRIDETTVVGRLKAPSDIQLVIEAYSPDSPYFTGAYNVSPDARQIDGVHFIDGVSATAAHFLVVDRSSRHRLRCIFIVTQLQNVMDAGQLSNPTWGKQERGGGLQFAADDRYLRGAAGLQFVTAGDSAAHFVATIGWKPAEMVPIHMNSCSLGGSIRFLMVRQGLLQSSTSYRRILCRRARSHRQFHVLEQPVCSVPRLRVSQHQS